MLACMAVQNERLAALARLRPSSVRIAPAQLIISNGTASKSQILKIDVFRASVANSPIENARLLATSKQDRSLRTVDVAIIAFSRTVYSAMLVAMRIAFIRA
jgi:hypothetical protein